MIIKLCEYCGNDVLKRESEIKNSLHVFCNQECYGRWLSEKKLEESAGKEVPCDYCGKRIYKRASQLKDYTNQFCGVECKNNYWREFGKRGEDSPIWNGGEIKWYVAVRNCSAYRQWRADCLKRDENKCVRCGDKANGLHVHHLIRFIDILNLNSITTTSDASLCEVLWDINNGITLCRECHIKEHIKE